MTKKKPSNPTPTDVDRTRQRLIEVAGELFAEKGFKDVTIRDMCKRANANVAAVNYHFRDKQSLYAATIEYAHSCARRYDGSMALPADAPVEERLRAFLRAMLLGFMEDGKPAWHGKLIAREMAEPTGVLNQIVVQTVRPRFLILKEIVRTVLGPDAPEALVRRCGRSIVGQALFYHFARPILLQLFPDERFDASAVDGLVEHIATFSLHALRGVAAAEHEGAKVSSTRTKRRKVT